MRQWTNKSNITFYENISIEKLKSYARIGGIDSCNEMAIISQFLSGDEALLDIGSGYGRIIDYIVNNLPDIRLTALERSKTLSAYIRSNFPSLSIQAIDFMDFDSAQKFDVILLLWSGLSDYSKDEHLSVLDKIKSHLNQHGRFFTDLLQDEFAHSGIVDEIKKIDKNYQFIDNECTAYGYSPSLEEMRYYADYLNVTELYEQPYVTSTGRHRILLGYFL